MQPILTLNSRSHVMLEVFRGLFKVPAPTMRRDIQRMHRELIQVLASKGIDYMALRSALVPTSDKIEAAFIFDSTEIDSEFYGGDVFDHLLPLLEPQATQSILCGDLLGNDQQLILEVLRESIKLSRSFTFKHATLLFGVYVNNLSDAALDRLHLGLSAYPAYVGYIPTTFASRAKTYLSLTMANFFLKKGMKIVLSHEPDRSNDENINITLYDLEKFGYTIASIQSDYFGIFLSYKIERPILPAFEVDTQMGLNAISDHIAPLEDFTVVLDAAKHEYLINEKLGKLRKAGLAGADRTELAAIIQSQVSASYIYNLVYLKDYDVIKFNLMIEVGRIGGYPTKITAALEYIPAKKIMRVITLY